MPTYDYRCRDCHLQFEARHPLNATSPACPTCGGWAEKVILCAPAMHGHMARGRELAMRSLDPRPGTHPNTHGPGCQCGAHHPA
ncbi:MAG: zinc ribbon domain-containing protein [Rhodocyclales bacterium CG17_big_fil_post_rev_8_21_14_2_50_68_7]|nr:MAG: zinc ribbon domain-containing protein [Rhodocyclales bacterium CG17_big_fil_post_rev_8_21_14_2_50_68_7]PIX76098.1 MAG: zinc ribbon domain-containing protein [Rhodocyclales bacterium CG_4_10_14_3_um_filter_68_10]PJA56675.1 MAG: zinc ribbon domain-containing protein [Rhodocyclales bacterium CG_4_9_14_3_um_filter_68_10]